MAQFDLAVGAMLLITVVIIVFIVMFSKLNQIIETQKRHYEFALSNIEEQKIEEVFELIEQLTEYHPLKAPKKWVLSVGDGDVLNKPYVSATIDYSNIIINFLVIYINVKSHSFRVDRFDSNGVTIESKNISMYGEHLLKYIIPIIRNRVEPSE